MTAATVTTTVTTTATTTTAGVLDRVFTGWRGRFVIFMLFLGAYLGASGGRLRHQSAANHFVYLAEGWLHGRLFMNLAPPNENDWGLMDVLTLTDGRTVKGRFRKSGNLDRFHHSKGGSETITGEKIASRTTLRFVSFPPFPALMMLPFVAIWKLAFNDVVFNCIWAALNPVLLFGLLRSLAQRKYSTRSLGDDLWLTALFGVGSVYYYSSVVGQVWYSAHLVGVTCVLVFAWSALDARRPWLAGLAIGLAYCCRPSLAFIFPFFVFEAVRAAGGWPDLWSKLKARTLPAGLVGTLAQFGAPAAGILALVLLYNYAHFGGLTLDFGHTYLNISWTERIERFGLFNYHFVSRNLACALVLMPKILAAAPYVKVSQHGMSLLITSPNLGYLVAPAEKSVLSRGLWWTVLLTALPSLLYQNSGYQQFGYRFSLDYMVFLVMLLAVRGRPMTGLWKTLVVVAIGVNLFGAIVFDRFAQFTYDDSFFPHGWN